MKQNELIKKYNSIIKEAKESGKSLPYKKQLELVREKNILWEQIVDARIEELYSSVNNIYKQLNDIITAINNINKTFRALSLEIKNENSTIKTK